MSPRERILLALGLVGLSSAAACAPSQTVDRAGATAIGRNDAGDTALDLPREAAGSGGTPAVPPGTGGRAPGAADAMAPVPGTGGAGGSGAGGMGGKGTGGAGPTPGTGGMAGTPMDAAEEAGPPDAPSSKTVSLVVADPTANAADDTKLAAIIMAAGYAVKIGDDDAMASQSNGTRLVVLSGTCASEKLLAKYRDFALPVLALEPEVFDDMALTLGKMDTDFGYTGGTQIAVIDKDSPLAAMFPAGTLAVLSASNRLGWGKPAATGLKIASLTGNGNTGKLTIFAYEKGALMTGTTVAPARRVGMFPGAPTIGSINPAGEKLVAAAIDWLSK